MRWLSITALLALVACVPDGKFTQSVCPDVDPPTYDNFGSAFFQSYCLECHTIAKSGDDRNGAPATIDFDTIAFIRDNTSDIDKQAAWGPAAKNTRMPRDGHPKPTAAERIELGQFIACVVANP